MILVAGAIYMTLFKLYHSDGIHIITDVKTQNKY